MLPRLHGLGLLAAMDRPPFERARGVAVRRARADDASSAVPLLYGSAEQVYRRYAGGGERALRMLHRAFAHEGNIASWEVTSLAEVDGMVAAALAAFPLDEETVRSRAFMRLTVRVLPPWRWPAALRLFASGARGGQAATTSALYVDSLATDPRMRRRGAARALLEDAVDRARALRLEAVALDTFVDNHGARALYLEAGFHEVASRPAARGLPGSMVMVRSLR
jgi:ribosomal protein S18 acetylase RimI-like enzyme